jgi:hypothetical protein
MTRFRIHSFRYSLLESLHRSIGWFTPAARTITTRGRRRGRSTRTDEPAPGRAFPSPDQLETSGSPSHPSPDRLKPAGNPSYPSRITARYPSPDHSALARSRRISPATAREPNHGARAWSRRITGPSYPAVVTVPLCVWHLIHALNLEWSRRSRHLPRVVTAGWRSVTAALLPTGRALEASVATALQPCASRPGPLIPRAGPGPARCVSEVSCVAIAPAGAGAASLCRSGPRWRKMSVAAMPRDAD